jgi:hypothetical protein
MEMEDRRTGPRTTGVRTVGKAETRKAGAERGSGGREAGNAEGDAMPANNRTVSGWRSGEAGWLKRVPRAIAKCSEHSDLRHSADTEGQHPIGKL